MKTTSVIAALAVGVVVESQSVPPPPKFPGLTDSFVKNPVPFGVELQYPYY